MGRHNERGFTLLEMLIAIALVGLIVGAFSDLIGRVFAAYQALQEGQETAPAARFALERMVRFVQESDQILTPSTTDSIETLAVNERLSDRYNNASHAYAAAGDGIPDADNDGDGRINDGSAGDPGDVITFDLDKADGGNWKLREEMPNYATASTGDSLPKVVICEHVTAFACRRLSAGTVEISLTVRQGNTAVSLKTTAKARWVD